ncbi:uncharacterized protein METZ01_LOCUS133545, partial [marine metagenome]
MLRPMQPSYGQMNIQWEYLRMIQSLILKNYHFETEI